MTDIPPSWQPEQPKSAPPYSSEPQTGPRMVRIRRPSRQPAVTYTIMGITVLVYLLQMAAQSGFMQSFFTAIGQTMFGANLFQQMANVGLTSDPLVLLGGKISPLITVGQYWRLITPVLLHASLVHIGFNMYALFALGPTVESFYGRWRFLGLYLLGGLGGNVLSYLMTFNSWAPSIGASTAIFGLIAAWGIFIFQNRQVFGAQARGMLTNVLVIIVINLVFGLSSAGIDNFGHLGGLIAGLVFGWFAGPRLEVTYNYPEYQLVDQRSTMNAVLVGIIIAIVLLGIVFLRISQA